MARANAAATIDRLSLAKPVFVLVRSSITFLITNRCDSMEKSLQHPCSGRSDRGIATACPIPPAHAVNTLTVSATAAGVASTTNNAVCKYQSKCCARPPHAAECSRKTEPFHQLRSDSRPLGKASYVKPLSVPAHSIWLSGSQDPDSPHLRSCRQRETTRTTSDIFKQQITQALWPPGPRMSARNNAR